MYQRMLDLNGLVQKKSMFLFGPRSTGKTTLLRNLYPETAIINLLKSETFLYLSANPGNLRSLVREIQKISSVIVLDEIQKIPELLNEIHDLIETTDLKFILTGSSARKLRAGGVNLLAGRAWPARLFPLIYKELPDFSLERYLQIGGMPQVWTSQDPIEELDSYVEIYLREEIRSEGLVQNLMDFSRFLRAVGLTNTEQLNYANISRDTGVAANTIRGWYELLVDTFLGFFLEPWQESKKRKAIATPKWYLFDIGVAHFLTGNLQVNPNTSEYGKAFEHFIAMELQAWLSYNRIKLPLTYWRSTTGFEVDFLVGNQLAIEVKATTRVDSRDLKGLKALQQENIFSQYMVVSLDPLARMTDEGIRILPWETFLNELWGGELVG